MSAQIENIKNPLLREFAEKTQHLSKGDFGMTVYGGVDLTAYAELIVAECCKRIRDELKPDSAYHTDWDRGMKYSIELIEKLAKE